MPPMSVVTEGETTTIKPQKSSIATTPQPAPDDDNIPIDLPSIDLPENIPGGGECLIATAAFGSELTPQVQFLRNFRDNHILSTTAGSSFMNVFNSWYYSFSPYVADYERDQPWLQQTVKVAIYPLLGILHTSEKAYSAIPGEYGALSAGMVASAMIGALYFSPIALSIKQVRKSKFNYRIAIFIITAASIAVVGSILTGNITALMVTTSLFVLSMISVTAILSGRALVRLFEGLNTSRKQ
jgi:peptide/nickel transport system substrate-binding protein